MKILFITYFFPPYNCIGAVRTGKTAEKLRDLGHEVVVVSAKNQRLESNLFINFPERNVHYTKWLDIDVLIRYFVGEKDLTADVVEKGCGRRTVKSMAFSFLYKMYKRLTSLPDKYIGWYWYGMVEAENVVKNHEPDIIYSSASPYTSHLIAKKLSKKFNLPWVAELRDLWADNHYAVPSKLNDWLEINTLKAASALVTVSDPLKERLESKYTVPVFTIMNGYDESDYMFTNKRQKNKVVIVYTGMLYAGKRDPSPLFEAIAGNDFLKSVVEVHFYGKKTYFLQELIDRYGLINNVILKGMVSREQSLQVQKNASILLLLTWNDPLEKGVLTGKLFEYIGAGVPILSIGAVEDSASKLVSENGFGLASNNPKCISNFIINLKEFYYNNSTRPQFERTHQIEKLVRVFEAIRNIK